MRVVCFWDSEKIGGWWNTLPYGTRNIAPPGVSWLGNLGYGQHVGYGHPYVYATCAICTRIDGVRRLVPYVGTRLYALLRLDISVNAHDTYRSSGRIAAVLKFSVHLGHHAPQDSTQDERRTTHDKSENGNEPGGMGGGEGCERQRDEEPDDCSEQKVELRHVYISLSVKNLRINPPSSPM